MVVGELDVRVDGNGPAVVLVHGALMDPQLWDGVVERLPGFRCIRPTMPLGAHTRPLPDGADRSPLGQARRLAGLLEAMDLRDVTLVGNDSGGAISQLVAAHHPERLGGLVLTNCDALDVFPPPAFAYLKTVGRRPWLAAAMVRVLSTFPRLARSRFAFGGLSANPLDLEMLGRWLRQGRDPGVLRNLCEFFAAANTADTIAAAPKLRGLPVRLVWGQQDPFFTPDLGRRLAAAAGATLEPVEARTLVPLDAPGPLAAAIAEASQRRKSA